MAVLLCAVLAGPARADSVRLSTDLSVLTGKILSVTADKVILQTPAGYKIPISRVDVMEIHFDGIDTDPGTLKPITTSPASGPVSAPVSDDPSQPLPPRLAPQAPPSTWTAVRFPAGDNAETPDDSPGSVVVLSRFRGQAGKTTYAGLYNFEDKGTLWVRVPQVVAADSHLTFYLFGRNTPGEKPEDFTIQARYLNDGGTELGRSAWFYYQPPSMPPVKTPGDDERPAEWFDQLPGKAGVTAGLPVSWTVPPMTRTIELRVQGAVPEVPAPRRDHLVGYLSGLVLEAPVMAPVPADSFAPVPAAPDDANPPAPGTPELDLSPLRR
ncbi:MAG: hypothetical protein AB7P76_06190 [Candidatus Melainabacteria bacterium]